VLPSDVEDRRSPMIINRRTLNPIERAVAAAAVSAGTQLVQEVSERGLCDSSLGFGLKRMGFCAPTAASGRPERQSHVKSASRNSRAGVVGGGIPLAQGEVLINRNKISAVKGGLRLTRRDHINDITGPSTRFAYPLNLMSGFSFPFLQSLTKNFQRFRVVSARLIYEPSIDATHSGRVAMAYFASTKQSPPYCIDELVQIPGSAVAPPYVGFTASADLRQGKTLKYLQLDQYSAIQSIGLPNVVNPPGFDSELYSAGLFMFMVDNVAASDGTSYSGLIGNLFMEYTVELMEPIWTITRQVATEESNFKCYTGGASGVAATESSVTPFEGAQPGNGFNSNVAWPESTTLIDSTQWGVVSNRTIWFPQPGNWKITIVGSLTAVTAATQIYFYPTPVNPVARAPPLIEGPIVLGPGVNYQWVDPDGFPTPPPYSADTSSQSCVVVQPVGGGTPTPGSYVWVIYLRTTLANARADFAGFGVSNSAASDGAPTTSWVLSSNVDVTPGTWLLQ